MAYDILLYISDQHSALASGFMGDEIVHTPNLDSIASNGYVFENAYTSCPLCVPARASLMTSRLPSNIGVFNNASDYKSSEITFAHLHALGGYDTTLIGRMHFVGMDNFHGFTKRIGVDFTPSFWGNASENRAELGDFGRSLYQKWCLETIGSGDSPVLDYDRMVVEDALEYLSHDHERPQLMVVGTYAPHFPYVANKELMEKYRKRIKESFSRDAYVTYGTPADTKIQKASDDRIIELRAAYYAMIETMDVQIGDVRTAFAKYLERVGRKGIFIYMSDHGDQIGHKNMYGKQTFFEWSSRIPLVFEFIGRQDGKRVSSSVSIMDIGPTLCCLNGVEAYPVSDGESFISLFSDTVNEKERYSIAEFYDRIDSRCIIGYMIHCNGYKLITYQGCENKDLLFNLKNDPDEKVNLKDVEIGMYRHLRTLLENDSRIRNQEKLFLEDSLKYPVLAKFGDGKLDALNPFVYHVPAKVRYLKDRYLED